jgi:hypothetical protein
MLGFRLPDGTVGLGSRHSASCVTPRSGGHESGRSGGPSSTAPTADEPLPRRPHGLIARLAVGERGSAPGNARRQGDAETGWTVASIARRSRRGVEDRRELPETGTVPDGPVGDLRTPAARDDPRVHLMSSSLNPCRNRRSTNVGRPASLMPARLVQCGTIKCS